MKTFKPKLSETELRANTVQYVRDMSKILEGIGSPPMSEETIQYTADRVFHVVYPALAGYVSHT